MECAHDFEEIIAMEIRQYQITDESEVIDLWERCNLLHPKNDPIHDIRRKLTVRPDLFLVGVAHGHIVASVMAGYEGHRGIVNYVAVAPEFQRSGYGREIMAEAERLLRQSGCAKINLHVRYGNEQAMEFYKRLGFSIDAVVCMGKRLIED
jgi:ribosomal protein S18 acetylase RimI-like enzyme